VLSIFSSAENIKRPAGWRKPKCILRGLCLIGWADGLGEKKAEICCIVAKPVWSS
jgi:hypothetical protein